METATSWHSGIQNVLLQRSKWWNVNVLHFLRVKYSLWSLSEDQRVSLYLSLPKRLCLRLHGLATARYGSESSFSIQAAPHTPLLPRSVPRWAGRTPEGNRSWQLHGHPRKFPLGTERWKGVQPRSEQSLAAVRLRFGSGCGLDDGRSAARPGGARQSTQLPGPARGAAAHARPAHLLLSLHIFLLIFFLVFFVFFPFPLLCHRGHGEAERGDAAVPVPGAVQGADRGERALAAGPGRAGGRDPPVVPLPPLGLRAGLFWGGPGSGRCFLWPPGWWGIGGAGNTWGCSGVLWGCRGESLG